jgi:RNA polymerase sigma-70 factor (ECF subfamily)
LKSEAEILGPSGSIDSYQRDDAARSGDIGPQVLAHLDAAHNLARWLMGNEHDAQDIVQEACLRAVRSAATFRGGDVKSWLLAIVRNACFDTLKRSKSVTFHGIAEDAEISDAGTEANPLAILQRAEDVELVRGAIATLDPEFREAIVLREMNGLSYKEIATITDVPMGTVMSRLARARRHLATALSARVESIPSKAEDAL